MEESTSMTIEFLRARLLSERSVSRTARHRADELAKRVVELEEQLTHVSQQRKKAEKATAEVLAILESNGISDISEVYDSSSDQEVVVSESSDTRKEEANITTSGAGDLGVSSLVGRSLSWKSCSDAPNSVDTKRRSTSIVCTSGSSTRPHIGRSCRQMKQKGARSMVAVNNETVLVESQENKVARRSSDVSNCSSAMYEVLKESCKSEKDKVYFENLVQVLPEAQNEECKHGFNLEGSERVAEMERALEHQAQLIGRFEAEENAQREWEDKLRENNCYTPESCEHGNQSDITEERDEIRAETSDAADTIPSFNQVGKSGLEEDCKNKDAMSKIFSDQILPHLHQDNRMSQEQQYIISTVNQPQKSSPEFSFPRQENLEARTNEKRKTWSEHSSASYGSSENKAAPFASSHGGGSFYKGESLGNALQVATHLETANGVGGVLYALQQAKLSLKNELDRLSLSSRSGSVERRTERPASAIFAGVSMDIPVGCAGLFRVPTSSQFEALATKPNSVTPYSESESSFARFYHDLKVGTGTIDRYSSSPYMDMGSLNSTYRPLITPYIDMGMGPPASSRYRYPTYADLIPRMSGRDGLPRNYPNTGLGMATDDPYSEYNDSRQSNVYNR